VAELWWRLREHDHAVEHALRAHRWAVADGEPYVYRYYLDRTRTLLAELGPPQDEIRAPSYVSVRHDGPAGKRADPHIAASCADRCSRTVAKLLIDGHGLPAHGKSCVDPDGRVEQSL
jgi:hypothetical protein